MISSPRLAKFALLAVLVVAALFTAPEVHAQAEFKKKEIEAAIRQHEGPTEPRTPTGAAQSGPTLTVDGFVGSPRKRHGYPELGQFPPGILSTLIERASDDDPEKPDYLFRLGELYADKRRNFEFVAHGLDQKILEAQRVGNPEQVGKLNLKKQQYEEASETMARKALELYIDASQFPHYRRRDEVLFRLGYLRHGTNKDTQAREVFDRLIANYPQSKYVPYAYLSLADRHFQNGEMESARKYYEKVTTFADSAVFGFALYKMGWVAIKLGNFETAIEIFTKVIRHCQDGRIPKNQVGSIGKEAKMGLVEAYARIRGNSMGKAWAFFQRIGGDYAPKMLESLADIYWEEGLASKSLELYRKLVALDGDSQRVCSWQSRILRNALSVGSRKEQVAELQRLGRFYEAASIRKDIPENTLTECRNVLRDTGKELALTFHMEAKRSKDPDAYRLAGMVHKEFLSHFKGRRDSSQIAFNYGELLWQMGSWQEAAWTFSKVARLDPYGRYGRDAASRAVLAWGWPTTACQWKLSTSPLSNFCRCATRFWHCVLPGQAAAAPMPPATAHTQPVRRVVMWGAPRQQPGDGMSACSDYASAENVDKLLAFEAIAVLEGVSPCALVHLTCPFFRWPAFWRRALQPATQVDREVRAAETPP